MSVSLPRFPRWLLGGGSHGGFKMKGTDSTGSSLNSTTSDWRETSTDSLKFHSRDLVSRRKIQKQNVDDFVLVSNTDGGGCLSGSVSDGPDWSIGWMEPHGVNFRSDDEIESVLDDDDDGFAVLVPCYRSGCKEFVEVSSNQILSAVRNLPNKFLSEGKNYMEWLSPPHSF